MLIMGLVIVITPVASSSEEWTLIHDGRGVKAYPDLREYVWQKNASALPHGPYDKIGLHRLVKTGIEPRGVFFLLPGTWMNGEQQCSNPPEDNWTAYEDNSLPLYLANRDFDVYAIDYRTHFVPIDLEPGDLSFMVDWGWDQWISDIKEAVDLAKNVSGAERIYMAGQSFGGLAAANYASLYWEEDLEGIILLDGGTAAKDPEGVTNTYNLTAEIDEMNATGPWSWEFGASGAIFIMQYAEENPGAPPNVPGTGFPLPPVINNRTGQPFANITEWAEWSIYYAWGAGGVSNIYGGYGNTSVMIHMIASFDRYWPTRLNLESAAIADWDNCPYVTYDFDDHYYEIDVPLLGFTSEFGLRVFESFRHGIANPDFSGIVLEGYGHLDVYAGNYAREDVNEPTYQWLLGVRAHARYKIMEGKMDTAGQLGSFPAWHFGDWVVGEGVPFATRPPNLAPMSMGQDITFSTRDPITGVVNLTVPAESYIGLNHTYWDPRISNGTYVRFQITLEEDGYGWLFTGNGTDPILGDVDYYVFSNNSGVYSNRTGELIELGPCLQNVSGPDGIPGTGDSGDIFGDGAPDGNGSSIIYLNTTLRLEHWDTYYEAWQLIVSTPFPTVMTTATAYNIVIEQDSQINGCNSTVEGQPWEFLAGNDTWLPDRPPDEKGPVPWKHPKCNAYVTYACVWSMLNVPTTLGYLDLIYEIVEQLVREDLDLLWGVISKPVWEDCVIADINCDEWVNIKDIVTCGVAFGAKDEEYGRPEADPNFSARADLMDPRGTINIKDIVRIAIDFGAKLTSQGIIRQE